MKWLIPHIRSYEAKGCFFLKEGGVAEPSVWKAARIINSLSKDTFTILEF